MDEGRWSELVERWEERDRRWEERDRRWEERDRRWGERDAAWQEELRESRREHRMMMREVQEGFARLDLHMQARHEEVMEELRTFREALWRVLDSSGEGPTPQS